MDAGVRRGYPPEHQLGCALAVACTPKPKVVGMRGEKNPVRPVRTRTSIRALARCRWRTIRRPSGFFFSTTSGRTRLAPARLAPVPAPREPQRPISLTGLEPLTEIHRVRAVLFVRHFAGQGGQAGSQDCLQRGIPLAGRVALHVPGEAFLTGEAEQAEPDILINSHYVAAGWAKPRGGEPRAPGRRGEKNPDGRRIVLQRYRARARTEVRVRTGRTGFSSMRGHYRSGPRLLPQFGASGSAIC
ncbi:unnamed protein product [Urochloa humidicola]